MSMYEYTSEFEAPIHSTVDVRAVGKQIVRTVVLEGEAVEFTIARETYFAGKDLEDTA